MSEETSLLAPATYKLVDLNPDDKEVYIPLLSRSYSLAELERLDLLELLDRLGWPHVEKN